MGKVLCKSIYGVTEMINTKMNRRKEWQDAGEKRQNEEIQRRLKKSKKMGPESIESKQQKRTSEIVELMHDADSLLKSNETVSRETCE
jgi:hypothetical protein